MPKTIIWTSRSHQRACIRFSGVRDEVRVQQGIAIIAHEVRKAYV